jgi:bla regulator protein blaR1
VSTALSGVAIVPTVDKSASYLAAALLIWAAGATAMLTLIVSRQRAFVRSLGTMTPDADGIRRSSAVVAPMLMGAWRPRIVVPLDFEARYGHEERQLMLAHEQAHLVRHDVAVNTFAACLLCLFWFNPLMYWALGRFRLDQEIACDALVLARSRTSPRRYAGALLKTQLATDSAWRMPIGCHWLSSHPLKERVAMLKQPPPGLSRRLIGITCALALTVSGGYAAWAAQPVKLIPILLNLKLTVTGTDTVSEATEFIVNAGEPATYPRTRPFDVRCTPFLPYAGRKSSVWDKQRARRIPVSGQIYIECTIGHSGKLVATPALITQDGESATIEMDNPGDPHRYRLEINASASQEKIEAARAAAALRSETPWIR